MKLLLINATVAPKMNSSAPGNLRYHSRIFGGGRSKAGFQYKQK
jgi:hypothetical protein